MAGLLPRLFNDVTDWFDVGFPHPLPAIRFEDKLSDQEYVLRAELPGLDADKDVRITAEHGVLTVRAERQEEDKGLDRTEFRYGAFQRSVRLPANADETAIKASYRKGILEIVVPLTTPRPAGRQIEITKE